MITMLSILAAVSVFISGGKPLVVNGKVLAVENSTWEKSGGAVVPRSAPRSAGLWSFDGTTLSPKDGLNDSRWKRVGNSIIPRS